MLRFSNKTNENKVSSIVWVNSASFKLQQHKWVELNYLSI